MFRHIVRKIANTSYLLCFFFFSWLLSFSLCATFGATLKKVRNTKLKAEGPIYKLSRDCYRYSKTNPSSLADNLSDNQQFSFTNTLKKAINKEKLSQSLMTNYDWWLCITMTLESTFNGALQTFRFLTCWWRTTLNANSIFLCVLTTSSREKGS